MHFKIQLMRRGSSDTEKDIEEDSTFEECVKRTDLSNLKMKD